MLISCEFLPEIPLRRARLAVHVVTPSGHGIGFWTAKLWEGNEAARENDMTDERVITLAFVCDLWWKRIDLCGTVLSAAWEHDSIMVLALDRMFGKTPKV
jgi:hypothetical protein